MDKRDLRIALIILGIIIVWGISLMWASRVTGAEVSVTTTRHVIEAENYGSSEGYRISLGEDLKFSLSYERIIARFAGQEALHIVLWGPEVSKEFTLTPGLSMDMGVGYYMPSWKETKAFREAMWLHVNEVYREHPWTTPDVYKYKLFPNVGAFIHINYEYPLYKQLYFNGGLGYRYLVLDENIIRDHGKWAPGSYVEFGNGVNFSGGYFLAGFSIKY